MCGVYSLMDTSEFDPNPKFFLRTDWLSFWMATILALIVYLWTLAPDVTLGWSGILTTGANYGGGTIPTGYPLWTLYAWLFTKLLPFSNIAWRVAVSSAVAGALTCGLIALMVSRGGTLILEGLREFKRLAPKEESLLRVVCGLVAGLGFGFDRSFWGKAVIVDTWPFSILLLCITLSLFTKWFHAPHRRRYLYGGFFVFGLTVSNSQLLFAAALGLQMLVIFGEPNLRRDICFANSILFMAGLLANRMGWLPILDSYPPQTNLLFWIFIAIGISSIGVCVWLVFKTRRFLTEWKAVLSMAVMFLLGLLFYFYLPIASMTNPPVNWGYARTTEGFWHVLSRGQWEKIYPTQSFSQLFEQLGNIGDFAVHNLGWAYTLAASIPIFFLHRMSPQNRRWLFGTLAIYLCLSILVLVVLNPPTDKGAREVVAPYFTASHLMLSVWAGYGLILLGTVLARDKAVEQP